MCVCVRRNRNSVSPSGARCAHISHQSHKNQVCWSASWLWCTGNLGRRRGCWCGWGLGWAVEKSLCRRAAQNFFRPDTSIPQIYEAYCSCMPTASLRRARQKNTQKTDLGSVWPISVHGQRREPAHAQQGGRDGGRGFSTPRRRHLR